ncbi:MAG: hypothetical protein RR840_10250 [Clostridium sp.]
MDKFTPVELVSLITVLFTAFFRFYGFSRLKQRASTKEGRDYIGSKGGFRLITLDGAIFISVIFMVIALTLKVNFIITLIVDLGIMLFSIINFFKIIKE